MDLYTQPGLPSSSPLVPQALGGSLDDILADLRANPTFDLNALAPDHVLTSEADVGQDVFDLSHSLPPDLRGFQQTLSNPSRSAPPIVGLPDRLPSSAPYFTYTASIQNGLQNGHQQKQSLGTTVYDLQAGTLSRQGTHRSSGSRGSSEDDPPFVAGSDTAGVAKRQRRMAEKNRTAQKRYRERQKEKMHDFERQVEELSSRVSTLMREKANLESRNSLLERVVQLKDSSESAPPQGSLDMCAEEMALCSSIADFRNSMYNFEEPWSAVDVRGVTDKILMQLFDAYPKELMQCMLDVSSQTAEDPSYQRIVHLVKALGNMVLQLTMQEPKRVAELTCEFKKQIPPDAATLWIKCLEAVSLSKSQRQRIVELRSNLFKRISSILERRRVILQHLEESMPKDTTNITSLHNVHKDCYHKALEASEELRESLELEHKAVGSFIAAWYAGDVLTPMQRARTAIECYPYHPDVFSIVDCIAMQEGGESHDSFMASLTSQNDSRSLMPADSAFRMVSSVPAQSSEGRD
ncbi:g7427 [Coccomyxa viridis]|uniref:G7427 protein n=1 Tax=Coccomyxa viridis TaxID=1274662 RepID=A0ABP1G1W5_9CHLO